MKKILVLACFLVISMQMKAQKTVDIGLRGGLAIPNIVATGDNVLSDGYSSRLSFGGGVLTEIGLSNLLSVRIGVEYSGQGGKRDGVQAMSTNQMITDISTQLGANGVTIPAEFTTWLGQLAGHYPVFYADVKNTAKFDYLMIPVSLQVGKNLGNGPCRLYVNAGPFVSFLMSGQQISKGKTKFYLGADKALTFWDTLPPEFQGALSYLPELAALGDVLQNGTEFGTATITGDLRPVNVGIQGNVGLSYKCSDRNRLFIEAGGNYGFVRIQKDATNGANRLGSANVMVGYAYRIVN